MINTFFKFSFCGFKRQSRRGICFAVMSVLCCMYMFAGDGLLTGTLNRVVVLARFNGDPEFDQPKTYYENFFNGSEDNTVRSYFRAVSNGKLDVNSVIFPKMMQPENSIELKYCFFCYDSNWSRDYASCKGADISTLSDISVGFVVRELASKIESYVDEAMLDKDNDGYVDDFVIVLRGNGRGKDKGVHSPQIGEISERFTNTNGEIRLKGKTIKSYTIVYERNSFDTHCRFLLNRLGFPNLYPIRTLYPRPVGMWDPMDGPELTYPLVYNRFSCSNGTWVDAIPVVEGGKIYTLNSSDKNSNTAYKVNTGDPNEFFVLEYRNNTSPYNTRLPESGMLIYRVNELQSGSVGPIPRFYVFRKDGTITDPGKLNAAIFSNNNGRNKFSSETNPYPFSGTGEPADLVVSNIQIQGETLTFNVDNVPNSVDLIRSDRSDAYPNPTKGIVNITGDWEKATLTSLSGIQLFSLTLSVSETTNTIDLSGYPEGMYFLELNKNNEYKRIKIMLY